MIYGTALISGCMLVGYLIGELLGNLLGIGINIGGVGFSMLCILCLLNWLKKQGKVTSDMEKGILFWKGMYIPVVVAMSASQDVAAAVSQGMAAIVAGAVSVLVVILIIYLLSKRGLLS